MTRSFNEALDRQHDAINDLLEVAAKLLAHRAYLDALPDDLAEDAADTTGDWTIEVEQELIDLAFALVNSEADISCALAAEEAAGVPVDLELETCG